MALGVFVRLAHIDEDDRLVGDAALQIVEADLAIPLGHVALSQISTRPRERGRGCEGSGSGLKRRAGALGG
jgi:hypothetical protein